MTPHRNDERQPASVVWLLKDNPNPQAVEPTPHAAPARPDPHAGELEPHDDESDDDVLEGTIVDEEDEDADELPALLAAIYDLLHNPYVELLLDHARYVAIGAGVAARRRDARNLDTYERMLQAAAGVGDHETSKAWAEQIEQAKTSRHLRRFEMIEVPATVLGCLPQALIWGGGTIVGTGVLMAIAEKDAAKVFAPIVFIAHVVDFAVTVGSLLFVPAVAAFPLVTLAVLWSLGRRHDELDEDDPAWLGTSADADVDLMIDETTIARALGALRNPMINAYLKDGLPLQFIVPARSEGRGTYAKIRLPIGVTAEEISTHSARSRLASGLYRATKEVWPTTGDEAGILDLWVADKGALNEGAGPYPLLNKGSVDVFKGVPFGRTLRGDAVVAPVIGRNTIVGGQPEQGKSSAARIIMAGCALDPTVELRIWVPDANYDFEVFRRRCSRYVMGAEDEKIEQILHDLQELHDEIQTRGDVLVEHQEPEVTRALADREPRLRPVVGLLEEAHVAFQHPLYGEQIAYLAIAIVKLGRKRGIHLIVSTQAPTKDSMPRDITRNCANGIAFAVGDHVANDALLGQGAYAGGHRATELIPGVDRGTALAKGFSGQRSEMVQVHFLSVAKGKDQVTPLIDRALAEIKRRGHAIPGTERGRAIPESRHLLEDIDEVVGNERVKLSDVASLLRSHAPHWLPYRNLTATALRAQLKGEGVKTVNTGGIHYLRPEDLRREISRRSTEDLDDWS